MASNLLKTGHDVVIWNRTKAACKPLMALGAQAMTTPREAASHADLVISMVTDDAALRAVWLGSDVGAVWGLKPDALAIESSTVSPEWIHRLAAAVVARGARFLDGPVAGSLPQAEARQLLVLAGGNEADFETAKPVLEAMAGGAKLVGTLGQGTALKLALNALLGIQIAAMAEALNYLDQSGISVADAIGILASTPLVSPAAIGAAKLIAAEDFAPRFPINLVAKDFRYAVASARSIGVGLPMTEAAGSLFEQAVDKGFGGQNINAVARLFHKAG
jgi:3-hydroxyisobutyrate dehydrogenase